MKKMAYFAAIALSLCLASCSSDDNVTTTAVKPTDVVVSKMKMALTTMTVTVPEGKVAIVKQGPDTLAVCSTTQDIVVPAVGLQAASSKSFAQKESAANVTPITVDIINQSDFHDVAKINGNYYQVYEVVAFEDSKVGDYDYNDLVFHARVSYNKTNNLVYIQIQPIALGSTKNLGLGVSIGTVGGNNAVEHILFNNCRSELFGDTDPASKKFINTITTGERVKYPVESVFETTYPLPDNVKGKAFYVDWFITTPTGDKLCAISDNYPYVNKEGKPFGFVMSNINGESGPTANYYMLKGKKTSCGFDWWNYPAEYQNILSVYPGAEAIFNGTSQDYTIFAQPGEGTKYYNAISKDADNVVSDDCLYYITFPKDNMK